MKKILFIQRLLLTILLVSCIKISSGFAGQSTSYIINPSAISSGGIKSSSANNSNLTSLGLISFSNISSSNYSGLSGFLVALAIAGDTIPPSISGVKFDGREVVKNDFIKGDALLTAVVQDDTGISLEASGVVIDNNTVSFSNFVSPASYDATSGNMAYQLSLTSGSHTIQIKALDLNNNSSTYVQTLEVDTGEIKAVSAFVFPNPYNPNQGKAKFAYQLNRDANVTLYLFNEINQLVWQRSFPAGGNGGQTGYNEIEWDGVTDFGEQAGNGAYFLRIVSGGKVISKVKVAVLK